MADMKTMYGMIKQNIVIPAYSLKSVFFDTVNPKYFRVHNQGNGTLYCGTSHQPTDRQYDFAVGGLKMQMYAEPTERSVLFLYNPTGSDIPATVLTFQAKFDPLALILANMSLDFSGTTVETNGAIDSFKTSLPEGFNHLGGVNIDNPEALAPQLAENGSPYYSSVTAYSKTNASGTTAINSSGKCVVHFLTNDGEGDLNLTLGGQTLPIKSGETIQNLKFSGAISVSGTGYSFRALVSKG